MKKPITLLLAMVTAVSVAQYNKTYDVNGNGDVLIPSFVITNDRAESISLSIAYDAPSVPRTDYFIITKHDCTGKVIYNNRIYTTNTPIDGMTNVEALIQTDDEGVLIAGYHYDDDKNIEQPMLVKVDVNGNFQWKKVYYENHNDIIDVEINKISLCRVTDSSDEEYFIVASADSDDDSGNDVVTTVIKVDNNGNRILGRKYYFASDYKTSREYPGDIAYSERDRMYMITGYRKEIADDGTTVDRMFFFGIDNAMNVVTTGLKAISSKSIPIDQDMVYDKNLRKFAVTFTHEKNGYVTGTSSIIGFLIVDGAMNVSGQKYYWHANGVEHNSRSISLCASGTEYVICSNVRDNVSGVHNPGLLKIDNTGRPSIPFIRYNVKDDAYFGHHATTFNCGTGREEYVLVNEQKTDLRMIRTDINGRVCGSREYDPAVREVVTKEKIYDYKIQDVAEQREFRVKEEMLDPKVRECVPPGTSYRTALATGIAQSGNEENGIALYPTVLSADNARLTMVNNSDEAIKIEMHNLAGQLIYSNANVTTGTSEVQLNANGNLSEGVYLVKVYDAKGSLNGATKIVITK